MTFGCGSSCRMSFVSSTPLRRGITKSVIARSSSIARRMCWWWTGSRATGTASSGWTEFGGEPQKQFEIGHVVKTLSRKGVLLPTFLTSTPWRTAQPRFCQFCRAPAASDDWTRPLLFAPPVRPPGSAGAPTPSRPGPRFCGPSSTRVHLRSRFLPPTVQRKTRQQVEGADQRVAERQVAQDRGEHRDGLGSSQDPWRGLRPGKRTGGNGGGSGGRGPGCGHGGSGGAGGRGGRGG